VWRDHLGLNQQQFADLLKMNIGTLRKYELSINLPGSEALAAFGTTGVSLDWLVLGRGEMRAQPSESGDVEWKGKLEALKEVVASLDEERRSVVLDDAIARARDAIRMARLERIVQELNQRFG
jgi:transcriptional regulator with XRE-family HTH domain